jgi:hypothetical protein
VSVAAAVALYTRPGQAHKPITSKYTFNDDVFPIFHERCGRCHVEGGVGPMSLLNYNEAYPWAESIRAELLADRPPPWHSVAAPARELDVMLVWASGGTPQGSPAKKPPTITFKNEWALGDPDVALPMPSTSELAADTLEDTREFVLATGLTRNRTIRAIDVLPGNPPIVRDAVVYLKGPANGAPGKLLATWMAGQEPSPLTGSGARLPAGAELVLRVHYKKTWKHEGTAMSDRSTVGLYFAERATERGR